MHELFDQRRDLIPFRSLLLPHVFTDVLVIGSGVAGMRAALGAARHGAVILLSKADSDCSCTAAARGGTASPPYPPVSLFFQRFFPRAKIFRTSAARSGRNDGSISIP